MRQQTSGRSIVTHSSTLSYSQTAVDTHIKGKGRWCSLKSSLALLACNLGRHPKFVSGKTEVRSREAFRGAQQQNCSWIFYVVCRVSKSPANTALLTCTICPSFDIFCSQYILSRFAYVIGTVGPWYSWGFVLETFPVSATKIYKCSSPLNKTAYYALITYVHPPLCFWSSLDDL